MALSLLEFLNETQTPESPMVWNYVAVETQRMDEMSARVQATLYRWP